MPSGQVTITAVAEDGNTVTNTVSGITEFRMNFGNKLIQLLQGDTETDYDSSSISSISFSNSQGVWYITIS